MRPYFFCAFSWFTLHCAVVIAGTHSAECDLFTVQSYRGGPVADVILERCQSLRAEIQKHWLNKNASEVWSPRCEIVLHGSRTQFIQAIGSSGMRTYGSTVIHSDGQRISKRRIDLLANPNGDFTALTHELTHVILADQFGSARPPLWADEGVATLADSTAKRSLHHKDCMAALRNGTSLRIIDLLRMEQFTSPSQVPTFYGQSLMLVQFLTERDEPSKFIPFLELAMEHGYDRALREVYSIDGIVHLESLWREFAVSSTTPGKNGNPQIAAGG